MIAYGNGVCCVSPVAGALNNPVGFKVEVLDEMDPAGDSLSTTGSTGNAAAPDVPGPGVVAPKETAAAQSGQCACTDSQLGQKGCCNGQNAICDWISNVPKLLGEQWAKTNQLTCSLQASRGSLQRQRQEKPDSLTMTLLDPVRSVFPAPSASSYTPV